MKGWWLALACLPVLARATVLEWYCDPGSLNLKSDRRVMDSGFRFEIGVFRPGFEPTAENRDQWAENWTGAERVVYHERNGWFTSRLEVTDNAAPFTVGARAWIWGFSGTAESGEWILFRSADWRWPKANPDQPVAKQWNASSADIVILGAVGEGETVLQSAEVSGRTPPTTSWETWQKEHLGSVPDEPAADANGNGIADGLEYAFGLRGAGELEAARIRFRVTREDGVDHTELVVPRRADRPVVFDLELSLDMDNWYGAGDLVRLHHTGPTERVYRLSAELAAAGGAWFWRYVITPSE